MTIFFTLALLSCGTGCGEDPKPEPVRLECRSEAQVRGAEVLLRDIAEITTADKALATRLADISFGKRPAAGFFRALTREEIERRLVELGLALDRFALVGAREVALVPVFTLLQPKDVLEVADGIMRSAVASEANPGDIEFEAGPTVAVQVPPGRRTFDLAGSLRGGRLDLASAIVDVKVVIDGEAWKTLTLSYRLRRFVHAVVVERPIQKGQPFADDNVALKRIEAQNSSLTLVSRFDLLEGKVAARNLTPNRPLTPADVTGPAVVWRGEIVTLVSDSGRIKLATKARADQDGAAGARILVTNLASGKVLQATVVGPGVVTAGAR